MAFAALMLVLAGTAVYFGGNATLGVVLATLGTVLSGYALVRRNRS